MEDDGVLWDEDLFYGIPSFDNFFKSILAVFQIISKDNWSYIMFNVRFMNYDDLCSKWMFNTQQLVLSFATWQL